MTVLCATPTDVADLEVAVTSDASGWTIAAGVLRARLELVNGAPEVTWA